MVKTILDRFIAGDTPAKLPSCMVSASLGFGFFFNASDNTISPIPSPMTEHFPFHSPASRFESPLQGIVRPRVWLTSVVADEDYDEVSPEEVNILASGFKVLEVK